MGARHGSDVAVVKGVGFLQHRREASAQHQRSPEKERVGTGRAGERASCGRRRKHDELAHGCVAQVCCKWWQSIPSLRNAGFSSPPTTKTPYKLKTNDLRILRLASIQGSPTRKQLQRALDGSTVAKRAGHQTAHPKAESSNETTIISTSIRGRT